MQETAFSFAFSEPVTDTDLRIHLDIDCAVGGIETDVHELRAEGEVFEHDCLHPDARSCSKLGNDVSRGVSDGFISYSFLEAPVMQTNRQIDPSCEKRGDGVADERELKFHSNVVRKAVPAFLHIRMKKGTSCNLEPKGRIPLLVACPDTGQTASLYPH